MKKPHYAWAICFGCAIGQFFCVGVMANVYAALQSFVQAQNNFSNTALAGIITTRSVVSLICLCTTHLFYQRFGERLGSALCPFFAAAAFFVFGVARSLPVYYLGGALAGLAYGFGAMYMATILLKRWFFTNRGAALGICTAATGLATIALSPLLCSIAQTKGLNLAFFAASGLCLAAAICVFLLIRSSPEACKMLPLGQTELSAQAQKRAIKPFRMTKHLRNALLIAVGVLYCVSVVSFTSISILHTSVGVDALLAATVFSAAGIGLMVGKLLFGLMTDRFGSFRATVLTSFFLLGGQAFCTLAQTKNVILMYLGAVLVGMGASFSTTGVSTWSLDFSDEASQPKLLRHFQVAGGAGLLLFSLLLGVIADYFGGYTAAYRLFFTLSFLSILVILFAYRKKQRA